MANDRFTRAAFRSAALLGGFVAGAALLAPSVMAAATTAAADQVVGMLDGTPLTLSDLPPAVLAHQDASLAEETRRINELRLEGRLQRYQNLAGEALRAVNERVLALEAAKRRTTPAALLDKVSVPPVSTEEARRIYDEHARQINQPYEAVEQPLLEELRRQHAEQAKSEYLATLRTRYHASVTVEPPRFDVEPVGPARGPAGAPVVMVLFADFQCPFCAKMAPALDSLLDAHPADVRLVYRHLPLTSLHPNALGAALAAVCADEQGQFWPAYAAMYKDPKQLDPEPLRATMLGVGLDGAAYDACRARADVQRPIDADLEVADRIGLSGTPALFVNGRLMRGAQTREDLERVVQEEMARKAPVAHR